MGQQVYKTGIVGAMRGLYHAEAYEGIENMRVQALCEVVEERLAAGVKRLGVTGYRSYEEMLEKEALDIVHVVTRPSIPRAQWIAPAVEAGVRAMVLEKPIALMPSELDALCEEASKSDVKIVVNMQRRYWPFARQYRELVDGGRLREPHFIWANTRGGVLGMGTHLIDLILFLLDEAEPEAVWAAAEGVQNYDNPEERSPDNLIAQFTFERGVRAFLEVVQEPLGTANFPPRQELNPRQLDECNFDLWATEGRFWYRQCGTMGYWVEGMVRSHVETTLFTRDDLGAQRRFTRAVGEWLDDENKPHRNRLALARRGMDCLFGACKSALEGKRLSFPISVSDDDLRALERKVRAQAH